MRRTSGRIGRRQSELRSHLADILTLRDQGLLTQSEYEERLMEVAESLARAGHLIEQELPRGGTRFILRETVSERVLGEFDFLGGHEVEGP